MPFQNLAWGQMRNRSVQCWGLALAATMVALPKMAQALEVAASSTLTSSGEIAYLESVERFLRLELSLSQRRVIFYRNGYPVKQYPVAVGKPGWETPVGTFKIKNMVRNPSYRSPFRRDTVIRGGVSRNPLGTRWMGFWTNGKVWIGFHGTPNRRSIGQAASHGCVRMFDEHARELFDLVKVGTPVIVRR